MTVTEYRGYSVVAVRATPGSTVYRITDIDTGVWDPIFYSEAAAQRYIDNHLSNLPPQQAEAPV